MPIVSISNRIVLYDNKEIIVGRNSLKFVNGEVDNDAVFLSRSHLKLVARDNKVFIIPIAQARRVVAVNGKGQDNSIEVEVKPDVDVITLLAFKKKFNFTVKDKALASNVKAIFDLSDDAPINCGLNSVEMKVPSSLLAETFIEETVSQTSTSVVTEPPSGLPLQSHKYEKTVRGISQHLECSICFECMTLAHTVIPCGHAFCFLCIDDWTAKSKLCPSCQGPLQGLTPSLFIDNTVREIVSGDDEALAGYDKRLQDSLEVKKQKTSPSSSAVMAVDIPVRNSRQDQTPAILVAQHKKRKRAVPPVTKPTQTSVRNVLPDPAVNASEGLLSRMLSGISKLSSGNSISNSFHGGTTTAQVPTIARNSSSSTVVMDLTLDD